MITFSKAIPSTFQLVWKRRARFIYSKYKPKGAQSTLAEEVIVQLSEVELNCGGEILSLTEVAV